MEIKTLSIFATAVLMGACVSSAPVTLNSARIEALPKPAAAAFLSKAQAEYGFTECEFFENEIIFKTKKGDPVKRNYSDVVYDISQYGKDENFAVGADIIFPAPAILLRKMENVCFFHSGWNLSGAVLKKAQNENLFDNLASAFVALGIPRK